MSSNIKMITGLLIAAVSLFISASPALGEFTSKNGKSEGETAFQTLLFEGGGASVNCLATPEPASPTTWIVENASKEHVTKGSKLALKVKTFGSCLGTSGTLNKVTVKSSECELETNEPGTQLSLLGTVVSTCKLTAEVSGATCEIKIEPTGNKELEKISPAYTGLANENTLLEATLSKVTTHVNSICELAGVKATTTGLALIYGEELQLESGIPKPEIVLGFSGGAQGLRNGEKRQLIALNSTGGIGALLVNLTATAERENPYTLTNLVTCREHRYNAMEFCAFELKQTSVAAVTKTLIIKAISENRGISALGFYTRGGQ